MGTYDYSQNDPRWKDDLLGKSNYYHLGMFQGKHEVAAGCFVTSLAMMASYLGHPISPQAMNVVMREQGLLNANGDVTVNDVLNRLYDDIEFLGRADWPTQPAPLNEFNILSDLNTEIMVVIDSSPAAGLQTHALRVRGFDGHDDILVVDPWDGTRKGLSAYAKLQNKSVARVIYTAFKYRKKQAAPAPAAPSPQPAPPAPPAPSTVVTPDSPPVVAAPDIPAPSQPASPAPGDVAPVNQPGEVPPIGANTPPVTQAPTNTGGVIPPRVIDPLPTPTPATPASQSPSSTALEVASNTLKALLRVVLSILGINRRR